MFGYLRVKSCGLESADRTLYRAHFCSVCHQLSSHAGWDASLLTNYDVTLWNLVASGVSAECYRLPRQTKPCTAVPFRRVQVQPLTAEVGATLAAITVLLVWAKVEDAAQDGGKWLPRLARKWLGGKERRALDYLQASGYPVDTLLEIPLLQAAAEAAPEKTPASLVHATERALAAAFAWIGKLSVRPDLDGGLRRLGSAIATYVYLWDALDDLEKDDKSGDFNAIRALWGKRPDWQTYKELLLEALAAMEAQLQDLPLGDRRPVCLQLVDTLRQNVAAHPELREICVAPRSPRAQLAKAGFVWAQCDDGCCCDCDCCDGAGDGCHCIECSCCDCSPGDSCVECNCEKCCCSGDHASSCDCCSCDCCSGPDDSVIVCIDWCECFDFCCCCDGEGRRTRRQAKNSQESPAPTPETKTKLLLCPGCRRDLVLQRKSAYNVHSCEGCQAYWLDQESWRAAQEGGQLDLYSRALSEESAAPIGRGQRMCPSCQTLLRSPSDRSEPESCGTCGGRLYCS